MKLTTLQENLSKALGNASRSVASRAQLPILGNILLATDKGRLKISATNLETGVNLWIGAKVEKEGAISVPARMITEFVASLPTGTVELEVKENSLYLSCGNFKANFVGMAAGEFPPIPSMKGKEQVSFRVEDLSKIVTEVVFAAATDDTRPVLTGVLFRIKGSELEVAATDGYRLSVKKIQGLKGMAEVEEFKKGLVLPAKTLTEVMKVLGGDQEGTIGMAITPGANQVIFAGGEAEVISRLIEGEFPAFEKVVPDAHTTRVVVDVESLLRAVKIGSIFARDAANIIKIQVTRNPGRAGKIQISANAEQVGENESEVEAKVEGEENKIAFNAKYLLDFLNSLEEQEVIFEMSTPLGSGLFRQVKDSSYLHIIMPVRVQE